MALVLRNLLGILLLIFFATTAGAADRAIVVLDASGSMWGQIDGRPKLQIARDTLRSVLTTLPAGLELGLMAYGHREKGSCEDIELLVPPAANTGPGIVAAAEAMSFIGKTPLSAAVRQAAQALDYKNRKSTVVLVTDGLETCNADPCAVGRELEQAGVDLTVHVVGFGLTEAQGRQVACLAENTGGKYIQASDASALSQALAETVAASEPPAASEAEIAFVVVDQQGKPVTDQLAFSIVPKAGGAALAVNGAGQARAILKPGDYQVAVSGADIAGGAELSVATPPAAKTVEILVERSAVGVTLDAPDTAPIASTITVGWTGPGKRYDEIQLFNPRGPNAGEVLQRQGIASDKLFSEKKVSLVMAARPGRYELRYNDSEAGEIRATRPIEVVAAEVSLDAPDSVAIGSTFVVEWVGPAGRYDDVEIFDPASKGGEGEVLKRQSIPGDRDFASRKVTMIAPAKAGNYRLRYWNGDNSAVLAEKPIKVTDVQVSLDAPASVPLSKTFEVKWIGPAARFDDVQIFDPAAKGGEGEVLRAARIVQDDGFEDRTVSLIAPSKDGAYELRYWNGDDNKVLATRPLAVKAVEVAIDAPAAVDMGASFVAGWQGAGARYDDIQIGPAGTDSTLFSARISQDDRFEQRKVTLVAPVKPGKYELRYWNGDDSRVLVSKPLEVKEIPVTLIAPQKVKAGEKFTVEWQGPGARYDDVQMVPKGGDSSVASARLPQDDAFAERKASLTAPAEKGEYELRYWNGEFGAVLAKRAIAVE